MAEDCNFGSKCLCYLVLQMGEPFRLAVYSFEEKSPPKQTQTHWPFYENYCNQEDNL